MLKLSNGEVFMGVFENDMINGKGRYKKMDGTSIDGYWKNNRLQ